MISPCSSNPFSNGGTYTQGKRSGEFSCQYLPEVTVLPFIDDNCNIGKGFEIVRREKIF